MTTLNINGDNNDPFYRYKMPILLANKTGRGNGCHTVLMNLEDVTESFNHPASVVFKFMGNVLGANTTESKWSINGHYEESELIDVLYQYIKSFVICPHCTIPELLPSIEGKKKNKKLIMTCSACGHSSEMTGKSKEETRGVDMIIKYLEKNKWKIKKGTMVLQDEIDKKLEGNFFMNTSDNNNSFDPFA